MIFRLIDRIILFSGKTIRWLTTLLVGIMCMDVIFRYIFNFSKTWIIDLEWWIFSVLFLIGASYTLRQDKHVRVDVYYAKLSEYRQAWINLIGTIFLLFPWSILIIIKSWNYAMNSWMIREGSPDPGGLPGRYIIKLMICIGFILLLLQGLNLIRENIQTVKKSWK